MAERLIKQAANNTERQETYKYQLGRYRKALKEEFYFEAMIIVYSMLEDRLKAFLYYVGAFNNRNTLKVSNKTKTELKMLLYMECGEKSKFSLTNISGKINLVKAIINWAECSNEPLDSAYLSCLKLMVEGVDIGAIRECLENLESWLGYRNEVMHAAMNKNLDALYNGLDEKVELGMAFARELDSYVKLLKKDNSVRKMLKMGNG